MVNLFEVAKSYVKKDIFSLPEIDLKTLDILDGVTADGARKYKYFEKDGWDYTVKAEHLSAIKELIEVRPTVTKVKLIKTEKGDIRAIPLD